MSFVGVLILIYVPVIRNFFAFGSMDLVDWLFPVVGCLLFFGIVEGIKMLKRNKESTQSYTSNISPATNKTVAEEL